MKKQAIFFILIVLTTQLFAVWVPEKPYPERLVNDLAGMFSNAEKNSLENIVADFSMRTSTQIAIVTVKDLHNEEINMVATEIIHKWGIGQADKDNAALILIKPKTAGSEGKVYIATGYGLEAVIPDAIAKRIVENEVLPSFRKGDYYIGVEKAVNTMMQLSLGEFSAKDYEERTASNEAPSGVIIILVLLFILFFGFAGRASRMGKRSIGRNLPFWILMSMLANSGSGGKGKWGNFSSGRGGFGGGFGGRSGGGFGGFGGGSAGGGGAGGSW